MNVHFCEEAKKGASSQKIGQVVEKCASQEAFQENLSVKAQFVTALAVEARMKGLLFTPL